MKTNLWNPCVYATNARYVSELGMPVLDLLDPQPGERVLDLGCGDGKLTMVLRDRGCQPVGIDSSGEFIAAARALVDELELRGIDASTASPWYFPTTSEYQDKLVAAGFDVPYIELIPRPTPVPKGMPGFLETFADSFASLIAADQRGEFLAAVCDRLEPLLWRNNEWIADYVRLRFEAYKS